jgi:hypothetical protein
VAANVVIAQIKSLSRGTATLAATTAAYNALTAAQKALVTNYPILKAYQDSVGKTFTMLDKSSAALKGNLERGIIYEDATSPVGYSLLNGAVGFSSAAINSAAGGVFTIGVWVNLDEITADNLVFSKGDRTMAMKAKGSGGEFEFFIYSGDWKSVVINPSTAGLTVGGWHYIVAVHEAARSVLYIDGKQVGTIAVGNAGSSSANPLWIGRDDGDRSLRGRVAQFHMLNYAATAAQVKAQFDSYSGTGTAVFTAGGTGTVLWVDASEYELK